MTGRPQAVLALDQGTTNTTALVVAADGRVLGRACAEFEQHFPAPGRVEHDAEEIWRATRATARKALAAAGAGGCSASAAARVVAVGVANQRETVVAWDPATLKPLHRAIVWQDRRTAETCRALEAAGHQEMIRRRTGLLLDPYFSGTKLRWLLESEPRLAARARSGDLAVGTIDAWIVARLTNGAVHATDPTNASRTLLYDLDEGDWHDDLLALMGVPRVVLPEIRPSAGEFGSVAGETIGIDVPVCGVAGDQQAALYGQGCWDRGRGKCTYGTGAFLLLHTGARRARPDGGLLATAACGPLGERAFALEGSILAAGAAVQWLRDGLGLLESAAESEQMARSLDGEGGGALGNGGVYMVPAFTGLGTPHWCSDARGTIAGLTRGATSAHLARAALEAMAYGTRDLLEAMERSAGAAASELKVDGGASRNDWLMGFLAGILGVPVRRAGMVETTALGAAGLAGVRAGVWRSPEDFRDALPPDCAFQPSIDADERALLLEGWQAAVRGALAATEGRSPPEPADRPESATRPNSAAQ